MPSTQDHVSIASALSLSGSSVDTDPVLNNDFDYLQAHVNLSIGNATSMQMAPMMLDQEGNWRNYYDANGTRVTQTFTADFDAVIMIGSEAITGIRASPAPIMAHAFLFRFVGMPTLNTAVLNSMVVWGFRDHRIKHFATR